MQTNSEGERCDSCCAIKHWQSVRVCVCVCEMSNGHAVLRSMARESWPRSALKTTRSRPIEIRFWKGEICYGRPMKRTNIYSTVYLHKDRALSPGQRPTPALHLNNNIKYASFQLDNHNPCKWFISQLLSSISQVYFSVHCDSFKHLVFR